MRPLPDPPRSASGREAIDVARDVAHAAGRRALEAFRQPHDVTVKGRGNLVTQTDLAVEALIRESLRREYPEHGLLSEETASETPLDGWVWVADPIDGTRNFVSGIPFFCVNLALCADGEPVVGVTHEPVRDETFWAQAGRGAWVNDTPARVSTVERVEEAVFGIDLGYDNERGRESLEMLLRLFPGVQGFRIPGSAALGLAYAACGRFDLFLHRFLFPWDLAAGMLLVHEAGGVITRDDGSAITLTSETALGGARQAHAEFLRWQRDHGELR